ncbi:hypothetical protein DFH08DRAFT_808302 [Mycena albidolilacea]|uniref:Uncharacterized protein n=1 Tax=Mycena albidolilacea TaxID=1033008 RepID=A0AAD7A349_9AGAR|nr:hypothetical protein DFH08DRAFT_808302 [Mycena albidolilacea]
MGPTVQKTSQCLYIKNNSTSQTAPLTVMAYGGGCVAENSPAFVNKHKIPHRYSQLEQLSGCRISPSIGIGQLHTWGVFLSDISIFIADRQIQCRPTATTGVDGGSWRQLAALSLYPSRTMGKTPTPWPAPRTLDRLVQNSSGYFNHASTVVKFVDDEYSRVQTVKATGYYSKSPTSYLECLPDTVHVLVTSLCFILYDPADRIVVEDVKHYLAWNMVTLH